MKDCKRIKGFKPFFNVDYKDIKLGPSVFASNIFSVLDKSGVVLPFIAKMELEINSENLHYKNKKEVENEVHIQSYAGLHGIAPKIYDFFECKHASKEYYTLLMEKIDGVTLDDFIQEHGASLELKKKLKSSLDKLYDLGIRHDDKHGGNFIITVNGIYIIDFGDVKLYKSKVPQTERTYTIQTNNGYLVVGKEDPMVEKIKKEKIEKMKKVVNDAKKIGLINDIKNLEKKVEEYKKNGKQKMADVYTKVVQQKKDQIKKLN
jgi:tRNA A-37 threonylcarbamoyl transferase component Bud32